MKSLLIVIISLTMMFPASVFANSRKTSSVTTVNDLAEKVNISLRKLARDGWKTSKTGNERRMINREKGLAIKIVSRKKQNEKRLLIAVYKTTPSNMESVFEYKNQLGYKRVTINYKSIKRNNVRVRTELDRALKSLASEIKHKLISRNANASVISKIVNFLIPSAQAGTAGKVICTTVGFIMVAVISFAAHLLVTAFIGAISASGASRIIARHNEGYFLLAIFASFFASTVFHTIQANRYCTRKY